MTLIDLLRDYARYNTWANQHMADWLQSGPEALITHETTSSFPTLRATLLHIWGAQDIWLRRLQGETPTRFLADTFSGTNREMFEGLQAQSEAFAHFLEACPETFFQASTVYRNLKGQAFTTPNTEVILHCLQHSAYHRGQLVTMGRSLGLTNPPSTDYIAYSRLKSIS